MNKSKLTQPLKYHGGKHYLASKIISLMPRHIHYVEPYAGGLAVLLARDPQDQSLWLAPNKGVSEVVNDIDHVLMNFWKVLQSSDNFNTFCRRMQATPLSKMEFANSFDAQPSESRVKDAINFFILARQSRSGLMKTFTPLTRTRLRRGMNGNASEWLGAVEGLADVHERLKGVVIECAEATKVIEREDTPNTLYYCDPPYCEETVSSPGSYQYRMTRDDHIKLLEVLRGCKGKVMLSGYRNELYSDMLRGWNFRTFSQPNQVSGAKIKDRREECLWMNY